MESGHQQAALSLICPEQLLCEGALSSPWGMSIGISGVTVYKAWKERQILDVTLLRGKLPFRVSKKGTEAAGP